jgi:hypothetical protein
MQITKFPDMDRVLEIRIAGWMERAIEISGGKQPDIKITVIHDGGSPIGVPATWKCFIRTEFIIDIPLIWV